MRRPETMQNGPSALADRAAGRRLDLIGVWKRYESGPEVVKDVSFTLEPGEFLTLLGPSGSGKVGYVGEVGGQYRAPACGILPRR